MPQLDSNPRIAEFVLTEASGQRSRENITVTQSGTEILSGTLLGKITASGKYVPYSNVATDGSEVAAGVLYNYLPVATGDVKAVGFVRDCEVLRGALTGLDTAGEADLVAKGVIVRGTTGQLSTDN